MYLDVVLNFFYPKICRICYKNCNSEICESCLKRIKSFEEFHIICFKRKLYGYCLYVINEFENLSSNKTVEFENADNTNSNKLLFIKKTNNLYLDKSIDLKNIKLEYINKSNNFPIIHLDGLIYFFRYRDLIRKLILDFKFKGKFYLGNVFIKLMLKNIQSI